MQKADCKKHFGYRFDIGILHVGTDPAKK